MSKSIHVHIDNEQTWNEFRQFVEKKYGKLHTVMGQELERAIIQYLADQKRHMGTRTHTEEPEVSKVSKSSKSGSKAKLDDMTQQFLEVTGDSERFQRYYAERLVKENFGIDPRTIEKYCDELENAWLRVYEGRL